jgi:hypothetical protein
MLNQATMRVKWSKCFFFFMSFYLT